MSAVVGRHCHRSLALFLLLPFLIIVAQNVLHGLVQCKHQTEDTRQKQNLQQDACIVVTLYVLHGLVQTPDRTHSAGTESATRCMHRCNIVCTPWSCTNTRQNTLSRNRICNNTKQNMLDGNRICNKTYASL